MNEYKYDKFGKSKKKYYEYDLRSLKDILKVDELIIIKGRYHVSKIQERINKATKTKKTILGISIGTAGGLIAGSIFKKILLTEGAIAGFIPIAAGGLIGGGIGALIVNSVKKEKKTTNSFYLEISIIDLTNNKTYFDDYSGTNSLTFDYTNKESFFKSIKSKSDALLKEIEYKFMANSPEHKLDLYR